MFSSKCRLFHNATLFGVCITHILNTECAKIKKKKIRRQKVNVHKKEHSSSIKHRKILTGDSHVRGFASSLKSLLNSEYDLFSVVEPGSGSNEIKETAKEVIRQFSYDDLIIICSGTNDLELNCFTVTFQNIKNFIMNNNHTNILLMNIPFCYNLPNSHVLNKEISVLNNKLQKLVRVFPHTSFIVSYNDRKLFTKHGVHRNRLGNKLLASQLGPQILTIF